MKEGRIEKCKENSSRILKSLHDNLNNSEIHMA